jgi:hypothetical protein
MFYRCLVKEVINACVFPLFTLFTGRSPFDGQPQAIENSPQKSEQVKTIIP